MLSDSQCILECIQEVDESHQWRINDSNLKAMEESI